MVDIQDAQVNGIGPARLEAYFGAVQKRAEFRWASSEALWKQCLTSTPFPDCSRPPARSGHPLYSLSRYSPGTSSSGTSWVWTSSSSPLSAASTPDTTSASKAFASSINSSTLSESALAVFDNPCKSPDCPADLALTSSSGPTDSIFVVWALP